MKNAILKNFFNEYKGYLVETDRTPNVADQYCTYLRKACDLLNMGEGFIEAIIAISDANVQAALCEYWMAKLSNEFENAKDKILKKKISNYKSAVSAMSEFVTREDNATGAELSLLPVVELPFESVYDQKALIKKFNSRLITQERYYYGDNASFSARVINRIATKTGRKNLYKNLILNTRFLYDADETKFFLLKDISKLTIKTNGLVKIEVGGKEYDVYTQAYVEGKFVGFELLRVNSVELVSLDHVQSMHELYPPFLTTHHELCKFSMNVLKHRLNHLDMRIDQFATYYFNKIYPEIATEEGVVIDETLLMDEVSELIEQLELLIIHKSYNSSKNDSM
jgi:hypothetical protein